MKITAKEIATELGLSTAAVSIALNGKSGVSKKTRERVIKYAEKKGYDFSKIKKREIENGSIYLIIYKKNGAVVDDTPFFIELSKGVENGCKYLGYKLKTRYIYEDELDDKTLEDIQYSDCIGIILLGTEISAPELARFTALPIPLVLLDNYIEQIPCDSVLINNTQGAYLACKYLIRKTKTQPGHLASSYPINNFLEREYGFNKAIRSSGMSTGQSITHYLTPSTDGAYNDMKVLLGNGEPLSRCYFADNDLIAAGAMKALLEFGYKIPEDISIIGFDNMPISRILTPTLSTINVPKDSMGIEAVHRMHYRIKNPKAPYTKTEVTTELIDRYSC